MYSWPSHDVSTYTFNRSFVLYDRLKVLPEGLLDAVSGDPEIQTQVGGHTPERLYKVVGRTIAPLTPWSTNLPCVYASWPMQLQQCTAIHPLKAHSATR